MGSDPPMYAEPQRYPAVVTDRWGRFETTLVNDGQNFEMELRDHRFKGNSIDSLELVESPVSTGEPPTLSHGDLCSCTIEWTMSVQVAASGTTESAEAKLRARLVLGDPAPNHAIDYVGVTLVLHLPGAVIETTRPQGWMEDALLDLQRQLPDGFRLVACISCAFSAYHPAGSGFIGSMACFRAAKDAYRAVNSKRDLFQVWPQRSGFVQETFCCPQFERRISCRGFH
jgi:hypothetical protein